MAAPRWTLIDNNNVLPDYEMSVNPSEEEEFGKRRNVEHGANTANTGFVRQQSDDGPLMLKHSGVILHSDQHATMIEWFALSKDQTIDVIDHVGDRYEVIWTSFLPKRKRTIRNPRDFANAPYHYWEYESEMEVITVKSGPWEGFA